MNSEYTNFVTGRFDHIARRTLRGISYAGVGKDTPGGTIY